MLPDAPAGTMAAFAVTVPVEEFNVETKGLFCPVGQVVRYPSVLRGRAVKLREYACAVGGMPQDPEMGNELLVPPAKGPVPCRVSRIRQGAVG
jgi:hypothetical protein